MKDNSLWILFIVVVLLLIAILLCNGCEESDSSVYIDHSRDLKSFKDLGTLIDYEMFNSPSGVKSYIWTTEAKRIVYGIVIATKKDKVFESKTEIAIYRNASKTCSFYKICKEYDVNK